MAYDPNEDVYHQPNRRPPAPTPTITYAIIGLNAAVYLLMCLRGVSPISPSGQDMVNWGADWGPYTMELGQYWRLITNTFLHFGIIHIAVNMYVLYQMGPLTEMLFGRIKYLLLYLLSGIGGSLLSVYVHPMSVGAGASGAIFGVFGALLAFLLVRKDAFQPGVAEQMIKSVGTSIGLNLVLGFTVGFIDVAAHIGGLIMGFAAGCALAMAHASDHRQFTRNP